MKRALNEYVASRISEPDKPKRLSGRITPEEDELLTYYANKFGVSKVDFLMFALSHTVKWINQDYDLPTAEIKRLNQLIDSQDKVVKEVEQLQSIMLNSFNAMFGFMKGSSPLEIDDDIDTIQLDD